MPNVGVKLLASLNLNDDCERCFYIKLHCKPLPWQMFSGFTSSMDSFTKRSVSFALQAGDGPAWLQEHYGALTSVPNPRRNQMRRDINRLTLTGDPDAIFRKADGSLLIVDYKCARMNDNQLAILPKYEAQLNGYAYLLSALELGPVTSLALLYTEAITDFAHPHAIAQRVTPTGLSLAFEARLVPVELRPELIPALARRAEQLLTGALPAANGFCNNCECVDRIVERLNQG